ncbi:hypothetical protein EVJ58_g9323 [Rhodofomes roseus]|uniref:Uncharacterized protein n=1 Tax=Rhodofomes roseus TaxID=34475 RepID=A0A4Y9XW69_9APHY|nr:hypothetical protein EVJ58_g9323 [Rhodofomes roseus]
MGTVISAIVGAIEAVVSAIASVIMIIVSVIATIIVTIFDVIFDIICCNWFGGRTRRTGTHSYSPALQAPRTRLALRELRALQLAQLLRDIQRVRTPPLPIKQIMLRRELHELAKVLPARARRRAHEPRRAAAVVRRAERVPKPEPELVQGRRVPRELGGLARCRRGAKPGDVGEYEAERERADGPRRPACA